MGSQAILGAYDESCAPAAATMSIELDILPIADGSGETAQLTDRIEGVAGESSPFAELHGFTIDGIDLETTRSRRSNRGRAHLATRNALKHLHPFARMGLPGAERVWGHRLLD